MDFFRNHLHTKGNVPSNEIPHYVRWVSQCYDYLHKPQGAPLGDHQVKDYITLLDATRPRKQVRQATKAIATYRFVYHQVRSRPDGRSASFEDQWALLLARFSDGIRARGLSKPTEESYVRWVTSFLEFWSGVNPKDLSDVHALMYLSHLSGERELACAMRSQTANALALFFRHVMGQDTCFFSGTESETDPLIECCGAA